MLTLGFEVIGDRRLSERRDVRATRGSQVERGRQGLDPQFRREMNPRVIRIASSLRDHFFGPSARADISIFLCGGARPEERALRRKLGDAVGALKSKYRYSVHYPEDMFVELVLGHQKQDLLTLENLLARSVSAIVILLHSAGTLAELGAFSNHEHLKNKLVVVVDPKHKKSQSFINNGPIRHLRKGTSSSVLFQKMDVTSLDTLVKNISEASRTIAEKHPPRKDLTNPIACYELYLALLYALDSVPRQAFSIVAEALQPLDKGLAQLTAETVVNGLINNGDALLMSRNVIISRKGIETLFERAGSARRLASFKEMLSELRIYALNGALRRRSKTHKRFWGEAA